MFTLILISGSLLATLVAAAGLIASAQNLRDAELTNVETFASD